MNKKIKCLLLCLIVSANVFSQDILDWGVKFGFDVPLNKKDFSSELKYTASTNFNFGFQLRVGKRFYGQIGVDYIINKGKFTLIDTAERDINLELNYLAIPISAGVKIIDKEKFNLRAMLGIQYRALVRISKNEYGFEKKDFSIHNFDLQGGIGVDISMITIDITYRKAVTPVIKSSKHYRDMLIFAVGFIF